MSAVPVGANENFMHNIDKQYITGLTNLDYAKHKDEHNETLINIYAGPNQYHTHQDNTNPTKNIKFPVFDVTKLCSSWAPAVTSAMSISVSLGQDSSLIFHFNLFWTVIFLVIHALKELHLKHTKYF